MKKFIYLFIFGAAGAMLRFFLESLSNPFVFPMNTFLINAGGSFLLTLILVIDHQRNTLGKSVKVGITVGFLGALTTFSTFCKEIVQLANIGEVLIAVVYLFVSIVIGLICAFLGSFIAVRIKRRLLTSG